MAELGWYGLQIDEEYGGSGGSFLDATLFLEETARGQIPVGAYGVTLIVVGALNRFGTEEQKRDLLGRVVKGGTLAIAMSEPESGSDVAASRRERGSRTASGSLERRQDVVLLRPQGEPYADRLPHRRGRARTRTCR